MNEIQFLMYESDEKIEVVVKDETIWATQKAIAGLFDVDRTSISRHLKNIFETGELDEKVVSAEIAHTTQHGAMEGKTQTKPVKYYNLDAIISIGYRVNSKKATKFRIWATDVLKEYIQKGFKIDVERMKQGETVFGKDYFRELLETVRSIRASERRIWQQITDVFAEISYDYDKNSEITKKFYATVQNKFHYAITGKTAAEIVYDSADKNKEHMGLDLCQYFGHKKLNFFSLHSINTERKIIKLQEPHLQPAVGFYNPVHCASFCGYTKTQYIQRELF